MKRGFVIFVLILLSFSFIPAFSINDLLPGITGNAIHNTNLDEIIGNYSGFYKFPESFFDGASLPKNQLVKITDVQYLSLIDLHNGIKPYDFCKIEYQQDVYGMTTPYGIKLGDVAKPSLNQGHYRWEVMSHEQGHNFFGGTSGFYWTVVDDSGPFVQESFAVLSAFYSFDYIKKNKVGLGISPLAMKDLTFDFANGRNYQKEMYNEYTANGKNFDMQDVKTSQALDYLMITYGEKYGFENYKKLSRAFSNEMTDKFDFYSDGVSDTETSTYVIAALGASFKREFRPDFRDLNFPIDDVMYEKVYTVLSNEFYGDDSVPSYVKEKINPDISPQQRPTVLTRIRNIFRN